MPFPPPSKLPLPIGDLDPHGSLGPPESSTQTASRSVQPFCRVDYCDRLDYLVGNNRPHLTCTCKISQLIGAIYISQGMGVRKALYCRQSDFKVTQGHSYWCHIRQAMYGF